VHIFDVNQQVVLLRRALWFLSSVVSCRGKLLFVGGESKFHREAVECEHYFMKSSWYGGTLTNFKCVRKKVKLFETGATAFEYDDFDEMKFPNVPKPHLGEEIQ